MSIFPVDKQNLRLEGYYKQNLGAHVKYKPFQGCCGFHEIYGWEMIPLADHVRHKQIAVELLSDRNRWAPAFAGEPAALVTTIADYQVHPMSEIFLAAGFPLLTKGTNQKTKNSVFMFVKTLHKTDKTGVMK